MQPAAPPALGKCVCVRDVTVNGVVERFQAAQRIHIPQFESQRM